MSSQYSPPNIYPRCPRCGVFLVNTKSKCFYCGSPISFTKSSRISLKETLHAILRHRVFQSSGKKITNSRHL